MSTPLLVGLTGLKGSGKTFCAQHLVNAHYFWRVRFAGPIKEMLRVLGLGEAELLGDKKELPCEALCGKTPRHAMQSLGSEWGRNMIHPDLWVMLGMSKARMLLERGRSVVIDDVRFPNEVEAIKRAGGIIVGIDRPGLPVDNHDSENQIAYLEVDWTIDNKGDNRAVLADLEDALSLERKS